MKLLGKKALVTGAARGIGRGCALELARAGADVAINDRERTPQAEAVVTEIQSLGRQAVLVEGSVFERPSCESVVKRADQRSGTHRHPRQQPRPSAASRFPRFRSGDFRQGDRRNVGWWISHEPACGTAHGRTRRRGKDRLHLELPRSYPLCPKCRLQRRQGGTEPDGLHDRRRALSVTESTSTSSSRAGSTHLASTKHLATR